MQVQNQSVPGVYTQENFNEVVIKITQATVLNVCSTIKKLSLEQFNNVSVPVLQTKDITKSFALASNWEKNLTKCTEIQKKVFSDVVNYTIEALEKGRDRNCLTDMTTVLEKSEGCSVQTSKVVRGIAFHTMVYSVRNKK